MTTISHIFPASDIEQARFIFRLGAGCPGCDLNWGLNPPAECGKHTYRCIECKRTYEFGISALQVDSVE